MGRYRSRSRSYSPRRSRSPLRRKQYDDSRSSRARRSPAPSGLLIRNISLHARKRALPSCGPAMAGSRTRDRPPSIWPEDLRTRFERFGPLKDVYLPKDYYTGEPRGFGFVKFRFAEDAAEAKKQMNNTVLGGREIRIVFAEENRKTPQEMRGVSRISSRGSYRRRSPLRSPSRRHRSYSPSPSPIRSDLRGSRARDDYYSPHRSRSNSRSVSPRNERNNKASRGSSRRSRSVSQSLSPRDEINYRSNRRYPSPGQNARSPHGERDHPPSRSHSPRGSTQNRSRSYSPR